MNISIQVPSKTYILGEYAVLEGGPALIVATEPYFSLTAKTGGQGVCEGVHPSSPGGQLVRRESHLFSGLHLKIKDPHEGQGGFGGSGAQFLALLLLRNLLDQKDALKDLSAEVLLEEYFSTPADSKLSLGSGGDLMSQFYGGVVEFQKQPLGVSQRRWPFSDYSFLLFRTGEKLETHSHLAKDLPELSLQGLKRLAESGAAAFRNGDAPQLIQSINEYREELARLELTTAPSLKLLSALTEAFPDAGVKACGAMGAEVILMMVPTLEKDRAFQFAKNLDLEMVASEKQISRGVHMELMPEPQDVVIPK